MARDRQSRRDRHGDFLFKLFRLSLVLAFDLERRTFRLHDVVRSYVLREAEEQRIKSLHGKLAFALRGENDENRNQPAEQDYFYRRLPLPLAEAGERAILNEMLLDAHGYGPSYT
jgi:hypothetical protein